MVRLPPPDPFESSGADPPGLALSAPAVVYLAGRPTAGADLVADAILALRPGALVVAVA
jgi:hypothetical protein